MDERTVEMLIVCIGFIGYGTNVAGNLLLAWKRTSGWIVRAVSIVAWGIYAASIDSWPMIANSVTFFVLNCIGFAKWRKQDREAQWLEKQRRAA